MRYTRGIAVSAFLFSLFAGVAVAAPRASPTEPTIHLARQEANVPRSAVPSSNTAVENPTSLADNGEIDVDAANTTATDAGGDTGATDSTGAVGGLLSGLTDTVGSIVSGVTGAVGNVADSATSSNAVGGLLGGVTDTVDGVVGGATGVAGSVVDGATGLKRNAGRAFFRRRLDARYIEDLA